MTSNEKNHTTNVTIGLRIFLYWLRQKLRKNLIRNWGTMHLLLARMRPGGGTICGAQTDIVIEGYPRSANTFAVEAFRLLNGSDVRLAHHLHVPLQIKRAAKMKKPVLLLIRAPEDAVIAQSLCGILSLKEELQLYINFYEGVMPFIDCVELVLFEEVTSDFGNVMVRLNQRFGSSFAARPIDPEDVLTIKKNIQGHVRKDIFNEMYRRKGLNSTEIGMPSKERSAKKATMKSNYYHPSLVHLRERAEDAYGELRSIAKKRKLK